MAKLTFLVTLGQCIWITGFQLTSNILLQYSFSFSLLIPLTTIFFRTHLREGGQCTAHFSSFLRGHLSQHGREWNVAPQAPEISEATGFRAFSNSVQAAVKMNLLGEFIDQHRVRCYWNPDDTQFYILILDQKSNMAEKQWVFLENKPKIHVL